MLMKIMEAGVFLYAKSRKMIFLYSRIGHWRMVMIRMHHMGNVQLIVKTVMEITALKIADGFPWMCKRTTEETGVIKMGNMPRRVI